MKKDFFKVYTFDFSEHENNAYFDTLKQFLDEEERDSLTRQKNKNRAFQTLFSRALIAYALKDNGYSFEYIKKDETGKPYFEKCTLKVGISHSGKRVAVFLGTVDGGIDIQIKKELKAKKENRFFKKEDIKKQKTDKFHLCKVFSMYECKYKYNKEISENTAITDFSDKDYFFFVISEDILPDLINL